MVLIVYGKGEYGTFIPIYPELFEGKVVPESLEYLIHYVSGRGCSWIMFDRDIEPNEYLSKYEW